MYIDTKLQCNLQQYNFVTSLRLIIAHSVFFIFQKIDQDMTVTTSYILAQYIIMFIILTITINLKKKCFFFYQY